MTNTQMTNDKCLMPNFLMTNDKCPMTKIVPKFLRCFILSMIVCLATSIPVFSGGAPALEQGVDERRLTVHLEEVFNAKVSLTPFTGLKAINPIAEVPEVKKGEATVIKIPAEYLPGQFVLRLDYRAKESDQQYPAERIIFINNQDIEIFINPPYINSEKTKFNANERENTAYAAFMKENSAKRMALDLLRQFLLSYDRPKSKFYTQAVNEFQERRLEYNTWLKNQAKEYRKLYISSLFQFQYIPAADWSGSEKDRLNQILKNYFEGIDFSDPIIIRTRELAKFMDDYMRMHGMQAKTEEQRDSLFAQAGSVACEEASKGHPKVYGWIVDFFYTGYETYNIDKGMAILKKHIDNPNCLTAKKQQILKRLDGMAKLVPGSLSPDFVISEKDGNNFQFHKWKGKAKYKLLLFWAAGCVSCHELIDGLKQWYNEPVNKEKLDIVAVGLDETQPDVQKWETAIVGLSEWKHLQAKEGVNSPVARDYAILSTPVMFLVESENNIIVSVPGSLEQLILDVRHWSLVIRYLSLGIGYKAFQNE